MKKILQWSGLLTFTLGIVWLFILPRQSLVLNLNFLGFNLSSLFAISRFWDLLIIIPSCLLIYCLVKNDMIFNPGIGIISMVSFMVLLFFFNHELGPSTIVYILGVFSLINLVMSFQNNGKENGRFLKRLLVSLLSIVLINSLTFGLLNGFLMGGVFLIFYLIFLTILILIVGGYKLYKITPKHLKKAFDWINRE
jgi:hypothetical protein